MNRTAILAQADQLYAGFLARGAVAVEADVLLPAGTLLDLYGEDIRARAYLTQDPVQGEMMLRPDFTVPVVQQHMQTRADPARYAYKGKVFRQQQIDAARPHEYLQVGFEIFDGHSPARADAEVFVAMSEALSGLPVEAATGDIGVLLSAVHGLRTTKARKAALIRHIWRPQRFLDLMNRFGGLTPVPPSRVAMLGLADPFAGVGPDIGKRSRAEIEARIETLRQDAAAAPISSEEIALLNAVLRISAMSDDALSHLRDIAVDLPAIRPALDRMSQRLEALALGGVNVAQLPFEGSYGRTNLEYYDGFVFGFAPVGRRDQPIAMGGRYDALTERLGSGRAAPAVGGVIRPDLVVGLKDASEC